MTTETPACAWCGAPFTPNRIGRPRLYCSVACRTDHGHYVEDLPGRRARLDELEHAAATYRGTVPSFLANEIDVLRRRLAAGPVTDR